VISPDGALSDATGKLENGLLRTNHQKMIGLGWESKKKYREKISALTVNVKKIL
jgi:hypothetical protein